MKVSGDAGRLIAECLARPDDCRPPGQSVEPVALTWDKWAKLVAVNNSVNADVNVAGGPDVAQGEAIASLCQVDRDNCRDHVLRKRSLLLRNGWPAASLLVTEVRQRNGDDHTVLTVVTDRGDLVLDNRETHVLVWTETAYQYLRRQSSLTEGAWLAIKDGAHPAAAVSMNN